METLFSWTSAQFGLAVGLLVVAVVTLFRIVVVQAREQRSDLLKRIAETEAERDLYRDRWIESIGSLEVGTETSRRLAGGTQRRPSGGR